MTKETTRKTSLKNKHLHCCDCFCDYSILFEFYEVGEARNNWTGVRAVVCSSCRQNRKWIISRCCFAEDSTEVSLSACPTCSTPI